MNGHVALCGMNGPRDWSFDATVEFSAFGAAGVDGIIAHNNHSLFERIMYDNLQFEASHLDD